MSTFWIYLIGLISGIIIGTLILMLVAKIFKQSKVFMPSLKVVLIISILGFIISLFSFGLALTIILAIIISVFEIFLIKKFFEVSWGRAIGIWAVWIVFTAILLVIIVAGLWTYIKTIVSQGIIIPLI